MFAIIINEKGGAERREVFRKAEISIGRLQGNDVILVKGNVSKQHAKLALRDGAFFVADQNSTNGTYVNRKRIEGPLEIREGDRIYIGDYVLRVERESTLAGREAEGPNPFPSLAPLSLGASQDPTPQQDVPPLQGPADAARVSARPAAHRAQLAQGGDELPFNQVFSELPPVNEALASLRPLGSPATPRLGSVPAPVAVTDPPAAPLRALAPDAPRDAMSAAVRQLLDAVQGRFGDAALGGSVDAALRGEIETFLNSQLGANANTAAAVQAAREELFDVGPLGPLLTDPTLLRILVDGCSALWVQQVGQAPMRHRPFAHPRTLAACVRRLTRDAGVELGAETAEASATLPGEWRLGLLRLSAGRALLSLTRMPHVQASLEALQSRGLLSREVAGVLRHCMQGRINVLVAGVRPGATSDLLCALVNGAADDPWAVIEDFDHLGVEAAQVLRLCRGELELRQRQIARFLVGIPGLRLGVENLGGALAGGVLEAIASGLQGVVAATPVANVRAALDRLAVDLVGSGSGHDRASAERALVLAFGLAVELVHLEDGRDRVVRVCEITRSDEGTIQLVDLFRIVADGAEGSLVATGVEPRLCTQLAARGVEVDRSLFQRPAVMAGGFTQ